MGRRVKEAAPQGQTHATGIAIAAKKSSGSVVPATKPTTFFRRSPPCTSRTAQPEIRDKALSKTACPWTQERTLETQPNGF